jgi:hypothetical protein
LGKGFLNTLVDAEGRLESTKPVDLSVLTNRRLATGSGLRVGYGFARFCCGIDRGCTRHPVELEQRRVVVVNALSDFKVDRMTAQGPCSYVQTT